MRTAKVSTRRMAKGCVAKVAAQLACRHHNKGAYEDEPDVLIEGH